MKLPDCRQATAERLLAAGVQGLGAMAELTRWWVITLLFFSFVSSSSRRALMGPRTMQGHLRVETRG